MFGKLKWFVTGFAAASVLMLATGAYASGIFKTIQVGTDPINVVINGAKQNVTNMVYNGSTYVPLRALSYLFGKDVTWDGTTRTAYINDKTSAGISVSGQALDSARPLTPQEIAKKEDSIVMIETYDSNGNGIAEGSGIIISPDGTLITNYHVIKGAASIQAVTLDNKTYKASVVNSDSNRDIAVLKLANASGLPAVTLGDSSGVELGEPVVAIGNPEGLQDVVSNGIVSTVDRYINGQDYIQMTAPISPGSSGGALFDSSGDVIGITAAVLNEGQSINFAVPINYAKPLIK